MKKVSILGLCLLAIGSASAQKSLVKEVERNLKSNPASYPEQMNRLAPAFTNAETASDPQTWVIAGKAAYAFYDQQSVFAQMGKDVNKKNLGLSVLQGYDYFCKALPLDSVPDNKGKVKPKYSKEIVKQVANHYSDFNNAALFLWEAEDYANAVKVWEAYVSIPEVPAFKDAIKAQPDTIIAETLYNMGIGNSLTQNNEAALDCFKRSIAKGYTKKNTFDYAISAASQLNNLQEMADLAEQAYALYGKEDSRYIGYMINNLIDKKDFAKADALLDEYIANDPNNAQLYFVKGVLCDSEGKEDEAIANLKKSIEIDGNNTSALFNYGYKI